MHCSLGSEVLKGLLLECPTGVQQFAQRSCPARRAFPLPCLRCAILQPASAIESHRGCSVSGVRTAIVTGLSETAFIYINAAAVASYTGSVSLTIHPAACAVTPHVFAPPMCEACFSPLPAASTLSVVLCVRACVCVCECV